MRRCLILVTSLGLAACVAAEDVPVSPVKHLKPPKGVTLTPEQQDKSLKKVPPDQTPISRREGKCFETRSRR